ncbi:hypothetical protein B0T10DRAFT_523911 [Thelonectria olida]|uniref:Uncharacterized protein n=1 Tax=Thelonectria olida TaxID=1576542 RepID=A0A9P9AE86_9HYPO|nr:hypothetical protein B0T10DRAFT_523911 [Thelonectria olida]
MHIESSSNPDLRDLLVQLARFFSANESKISAAEASTCFQHLSPIDSSALIRLFFLLCPSFRAVLPRQDRVSATSPAPTRRSSSSNDTSGHPPPGSNSHGDNNRSTPSLHYSQEHAPSLSPVSANDNGLSTAHAGLLSGERVAQVLEELNNPNTPGLTFSEQATLCQQRTPNAAAALPALAMHALTVHPSDVTALYSGFDDDALGKTQLAACSDIAFAPGMKWLLEDCKTNRGVFLRRVKESKAALPTGQGWKAAIATKKENADMRDLLKIYHRFECYNIYRHVVEAGFHTGEHWVRDRRAELAKKLCDDFPERFQSLKAANKCLNWVDQGCRYYEWTKMFSEVSELGFLIALPSEVPRSAYTSRCTREQMSAAAVKFMALGICELVKDLELSELGNYIAQELRQMTTKKRTHVDGPEEDIQRSRKSPRLMLSLGTPAISQSDQNATPPEAIAAREDTAMRDQNTFSFLLDAFMVSDDTFNNCQLSSTLCSDLFMGSQLSAFSLPIEEWYQHPNETESQVANYNESTGR